MAFFSSLMIPTADIAYDSLVWYCTNRHGPFWIMIGEQPQLQPTMFSSQPVSLFSTSEALTSSMLNFKEGPFLWCKVVCALRRCLIGEASTNTGSKVRALITNHKTHHLALPKNSTVFEPNVTSGGMQYGCYRRNYQRQ